MKVKWITALLVYDTDMKWTQHIQYEIMMIKGKDLFLCSNKSFTHSKEIKSSLSRV